MTNLATILTDAVAREADRPAIRMGERTLTYADLEAQSSRVAGWLRQQGLQAGDRVGIMLPNISAFPVAYYGVLRAGGVVVPMNPLLKSREVEHYLGDSGAKFVIASTDAETEARAGADIVGAQTVVVGMTAPEQMAQWPVLDEVTPRQDGDVAVLLYTSGTTGTPKGAELTHANMRSNAAASSSLFDLTADDVIMGCLPMFHSFGQTCGLNTAVLAGASLTMIPRFDPVGALQAIERDKVTIFEGVPTMYVALLQAGPDVADTSSLRICVSGGAALPGEVLNQFAEVFGARILEGYGLSETSPVASFNRQDNAKPGSIGLPIDGVEMRVVDKEEQDVPIGEVGEILIRGDNLMSGYWGRPEATAEAIRDGWFHTGDMAKKDEDGFYFIVDRKKDLIIRGGFNVYPREIEEVLYEHPEVREAAVIGIPHPTHGEEIAAAVALTDDAVSTPEDLRAFVKERVAAYKYPRHVWLVPELPKGATGKIQKRDLKVPDDLV